MKRVLGVAVTLVVAALMAWRRWDRVIIRRSWGYKSAPDLYRWRYLVLQITVTFRERQQKKAR